MLQWPSKTPSLEYIINRLTNSPQADQPVDTEYSAGIKSTPKKMALLSPSAIHSRSRSPSRSVDKEPEAQYEEIYVLVAFPGLNEFLP